MKIHSLPARELTSPMLAACEQWRTSGARELRNPFFSTRFLQEVAKTRTDTWIAWIELDGNPAGLLAYHRRAGRIGSPLAGHLSDYQGVVSAQPLGVPAGELLRACRLELFDFDHLLPGHLQPAETGLVETSSSIIETGAGYEPLAATLARQSTSWSKTQQNRRRVEKELGVLRFEEECRDTEVWRTLWRWKRAQYAATGVGDVLQPSWTRELLERLFEDRADGAPGILSALWAGDTLLAVHFGMRERGVWHYWFPAYDPQWARYGPGLLLLDEITRAAAAHGIGYIDLGKGDASYKRAWATGAIPLLEGTITRGGVVTAYRRGVASLRGAVKNSPAGPLLRRWRDRFQAHS
ncbi:MAG TPA: GNAT family N-acetyltransferase [Opitutaceae bacterium]|nr:GNAT family N-acetyltransferase [Opitutaceae bacterium]